MRLIVCGGRSFANFELIERELTRLHSNKLISVLIHGWIGPAASVIEHWARENDIPIVRYPPNWELHGKGAETRRNEFMLCAQEQSPNRGRWEIPAASMCRCYPAGCSQSVFPFHRWD